MADTIRRVDYYYVEMSDKPGEAFKILAALKEKNVNLINCTGFPKSFGRAQLSMVPSNSEAFEKACRESGLSVSSKKQCFLVQGTDRVGAVAEILKKLTDAKISITAHNACATEGGGYALTLWVDRRDIDSTTKALGI